MDKKQKLQKLQSLNEKDLTKKFLIPLYESEGMGYKSIQYNHGVLEFGKDMICYEEDQYDRRIFTGIQVKATKIKVRDLGGVLLQITEAFGEPFTDLTEGNKKELDRVIILTSNEFVESAKMRLWASLRGTNIHRLVTFVDGNKLLRLLEKHCPSVFYSSKQCPDKDTKLVLTQFSEMLNNPNAVDFKTFFRKHPWLVGIGHRYASIAPEENSMEYPPTDLSLETFDHDYDVMVLKRHTEPVINDSEGEWNLSQECVLGISQVYRYFEWYYRKMEKEQIRPTTYLYDPVGFVVMGRSGRSDTRKRLKIINTHFGRITILTYDDIYDQAVIWLAGDTQEGN